MNQPAITESIAAKVLTLVDQGLVRGLGVQLPGKMCVEAAVCAALDLPHSDTPPCVHPAARAFKIRLNDSNWSSDQARAKGMRRCAIAQLGSLDMDGQRFVNHLAVETVKQVLPAMMEHLSVGQPALKVICDEFIPLCRGVQTREEARSTAGQLRDRFRAAANATAAEAADTAAEAAAYSAGAYSAAVYSAGAYSAAAAAAAGAPAARDQILSISAEIAVQAFITCGTEGSRFLYLTESQK